jgi:hypothetical protein
VHLQLDNVITNDDLRSLFAFRIKVTVACLESDRLNGRFYRLPLQKRWLSAAVLPSTDLAA